MKHYVILGVLAVLATVAGYFIADAIIPVAGTNGRR